MNNNEQRGYAIAEAKAVWLGRMPDGWGDAVQNVDRSEAQDAASMVAAAGLGREETLSKQYQGEIVWWLALELYVKSMRTPWILDSSDGDTAYVGLGFSPVAVQLARQADRARMQPPLQRDGRRHDATG